MSDSEPEVTSVKILTWNINGIRSLYKDAYAMKEGLDSLDADIICFQETKITRNCLDQGTAVVEGYNSYFGFPRSKSGYSGVATYCKEAFTPFQAEEGLSGLFSSAEAVDSVGCYGNIRAEFSKKELKELDFEGRAVITLHKIKFMDYPDEKMLAIINVYCPRADSEKPERLQVKLRFYQLLEVRTQALLDKGYLVIIMGDLNTCHKPIDHCDPTVEEEFNKNPCRKWLDRIIYDPSAEENTNNGNANAFRLIDAFRFVNPVEENAFTCWSTRLNARSTNYGTRIDYILMDLRLGGEMDDCIILKDVQGSDHCPVKAIIDIKFFRAPKCPSFCTKYYPEFAGTQKRLSDFFVKLTPEEKAADSKRKFEDSSTNLKHSKKEPKKQKGISSFLQMKQTRGLEEQCSGLHSSMESVSSVSSMSSPDSGESLSSEMSADKPGASSSSLSKAESDSIRCALEAEKNAASKAWKNLLTGPKQPPNCIKHGEPCIQKTVKKKGPNFNRKFWICCKGEGRSNDPNARCDFFLWDSNR